MNQDVRELKGSCLKRQGGKGVVANNLVHHFPKAKLYLEPFMGALSIFYALPQGMYPHYAVNDLDSALTLFFRVLRTRTEELIQVCELTPYSRDEFAACLEPSEDELEEARRVWVRSRQGFADAATSVGNWGRSDAVTWNPGKAENKLQAFRSYAERLRNVAIDNVPALEFIEKWAVPDSFVYCDPPYAPESRRCDTYEHEMTAEDHRKLAERLHQVVAKGSKVAISGYPSKLYDEELFKDWRRVEFDTAFSGSMKKDGSERRTEVLWMSYPASDELQKSYQPTPKATNPREKKLLKALQNQGKVR